MPKDRENELVQFILQYLLEHQFENKSDMARQLSMESRTVQRTFERLNAETGQKTTSYMTLQEAAAAERSYSWAANVHRLALLHVQAIIDARRLEPLAMLKSEENGSSS